MPGPAALIALAARLGISSPAKKIARHGIKRLKTMINNRLETKRISNRVGKGKESFLSPKGQAKFKTRMDKYKKDLKATRGK